MPSVNSSGVSEAEEQSPEMVCPHLKKLAAQEEAAKNDADKPPAEEQAEVKGKTLKYLFAENTPFAQSRRIL
jgi:hypothetical protein